MGIINLIKDIVCFISLACGFLGCIEKNCDILKLRESADSEACPHRVTPGRQCRHVTDVAVALTRTVKVGTRRGQQPKLPGVTRPCYKLRGRVRTRYHFNRSAAKLAKFAEQAKACMPSDMASMPVSASGAASK